MSRRNERIRWLWGFWDDYRRQLTVILTLTLINAGIVMVGPRIVQQVIDQLGKGLTPRQLGIYCAALTGIGLAQFASYITLQTLRAKMNLIFEWSFRQQTFEQLVQLSPRFYARFRTGDLVTRLTDDVGRGKLSWFACSGIFRLFEAACKILVGLIAMLLLSPLLTLISVGPLPLIVILFIYTRRSLQARFDRRQQAISSGSSLLEAAFSGIRVVKAYGHQQPIFRQFSERIRERKSSEVGAVKAEVLLHSMYAQTWQMAVVITLLGGGWLVMQGRISLGTLVAMMAYVRMLVWPMFDIGNFMVSGMRSSVSIDRLLELEGVQAEVRDPEQPVHLAQPNGALTFDGVGLRLGDADVLDRISFEVPAGSRTAIAGPIGAGKSMLLRLIPRLFDVDAGEIRLDGTPLGSLSLDQLRSLVGYVSQDPILFSGTIEANIRAGRDDLPQELIRWACKVACLERDLEQFRDGLQTVVGARGITLSGGQKQRVSIARALVGKPRVLLLDDCTASLDAETEAALWQQLDEALPGSTCLVSTHRTATLESADQVIVLGAGRVVETGDHASLIGAGGSYERLYKRRRLEESVFHRRPFDAANSEPN